ncbi:MAG: penicillin-binding protein 2 [Microlunatus sp.]|nr:penicillin-binding protein 2 [Microlunatus sp.]MDN5770996.1 penicillin-binding protein 2 [Microlunatus sp.]
MNKPIRRVALVAMIMFALLLGNVTYSVLFRQASLDANAQNRRTRDAEFAQDRGAILAAGKVPMAETEPSDDRFRFQRVYPNDQLYAAVTGFYSYDHGRTGLENSYNTELAGTDDSLFVNRLVDLVTNRSPQGATVQTTIVPRVQQAATDALGSQKGAVVALDPRTGAVLAMVTSPSYDPNQVAGHDIDEANTAWTRLAKTPERPLSNRAAREIYPPGSVFKLVTAAAALEDGMSPDTKVASPDRLKLPNTVTYLPNSTDCGGSETTLSNALRVSCNTAFANVGLEVGQDKLREQAQKFGFNARHLADLNGVASQFPDDMDRAQLALSSIGQFDVAASPLQMAMVTAAIANDGALMDPYVVARVQRPDLKPLSTTKPAKLSQAMSAANAKELQEMMRIVVAEGTGSNAAISGVEVGGKTGTAQSDPSRKPFAWFTSFAPVENPEVAVAVIVEDADIPRQDIAGGRLAAPIARATMQAALS